MEAADALRERASEAGILLDFDGTLSEIVAHPSMAAAVESATELLTSLAGRYRLVAIVSGRPASEIGEMLPAVGVRIEGLYGLRESRPPPGLVARAEGAAARIPGAWVEPKGASIAVHYRAAAHPELAKAELEPDLVEIAAQNGLEVIEGKKVLELVPKGSPRKGGVVARLVEEAQLSAVLYAGDDAADIEAFATLDGLAAESLMAVKVAVRGEETPAELVERADLTVDGPEGLVTLLRQFL